MAAADQIVAWGILAAMGMFVLYLIALISFGLIREVVMRRNRRTRLQPRCASPRGCPVWA